MREVFKFKEFEVKQEDSAMKIGTDGVLLGAWAKIDDFQESILDIGSGTGLISLMMAQRSDVELIDAVELDPAAYEESVFNFENSPWGDRLFCYHSSFQEFAEEIEDSYDLIVTNPPYFNRVNTVDQSRDRARNDHNLPAKDLLAGVDMLLAEEGRFACVLPAEDAQKFTDLAAVQGLYLNRKCEVKGRLESKVVRSLMEFDRVKKNSSEIILEELIIEIERHKYTQDYKDLVRDFYLKM
jgi:tRNA1Val (adenine37-N6)-methyltransferase